MATGKSIDDYASVFGARTQPKGLDHDCHSALVLIYIHCMYTVYCMYGISSHLHWPAGSLTPDSACLGQSVRGR